MLYCRRHRMVWGCQSFQSLRNVNFCIHVYFNSSHFSNKKNTLALKFWRALKMSFILRVSAFTQFCSGFQCGKSSHVGHFAMCSLYALLFTIYISWESNNRTEVANQDDLKWYGLCYDRLSGYDTVKFGTRTQSAQLHIFRRSHPGTQCLDICHAKYHILK